MYDLAERVIPPDYHRREVNREKAQRELLRLAARSCGVATAGDLADYYRMPVREARQGIAELVEAGKLREVRVEGWREPAYQARLSRRIGASALLSPFDPLVWYRTRVARLFHFDYRIEIFVPREKRRWGYYVLPFLLGDRLVARVDLKADRAARPRLRRRRASGWLRPAARRCRPRLTTVRVAAARAPQGDCQTRPVREKTMPSSLFVSFPILLLRRRIDQD